MATKRKTAQAETLQKLRDLALDPQAQAAFAATLLDAKYGAEVLIAVLQILTNTPQAKARQDLWRLYDYYDHESGRGQQRDPAAYMRASIVRALRPVAMPTDVSRLADVTKTYVFPPPEFREEGAMLRSAALAALNELDDDLARYHAVRLLANEHTEAMSGEPALTAAKVLAARGEVLPLYFYVMQDGARVLPEVVSVCLGNLTMLRSDLVPDLIARFTTQPMRRNERRAKPDVELSEIILVGLFDLLINHEDGPLALDYIATFLQTSEQLDAYRYLVITMATSGKPQLEALLLEQADATTGRDKAMILLDGLNLLRNTNPDVSAQIEQLEAFV